MKLASYLVRALAPMLVALLLLWPVASTYAQEGPIQVTSSSVTSEFPEGIRFRVQVSGENNITSVAVRLRIGYQTAGAYDYLEVKKGQPAEAELFWRTSTSDRYIPPGTLITYNFEVEDAKGARLETGRQEIIYEDARFQWQEVSEGPVSVAYHGPVKTRAELILSTITKTLAHMGPLLGADTTQPIRVTMYNNVKEMLGGLPPGSTTVRRELITEGQAFPEIGTLLVLANDQMAVGTASHEVTHMLTHRAGNSIFRMLPAWLDEGLAEYGNIQPGYEYDVALEFAIARGQLLPIPSLQVIPGVPEDVIIFYGEARSIVKFMVDQFGAAKMKELMSTLKSGKKMEDALQAVYSVDLLGLENQWRKKIGAPPYTPPEKGRALPTPISYPTVLPYSLTPQPGGQAIGGVDTTPTPAPVPEATPTPSQLAAAGVAPGSQAPDAAAESQGSPPAIQKEKPTGGGACSRPGRDTPGVLDMSAVGLLAGLVWLAFRRRTSN